MLFFENVEFQTLVDHDSLRGQIWHSYTMFYDSNTIAYMVLDYIHNPADQYRQSLRVYRESSSLNLGLQGQQCYSSPICHIQIVLYFFPFFLLFSRFTERIWIAWDSFACNQSYHIQIVLYFFLFFLLFLRFTERIWIAWDSFACNQSYV